MDEQKVYFVKKRGMKYEPEREEGVRKIKSLKKKVGEKEPKIIKKRVKRLKYKQKGLTEQGESASDKLKKVEEERKITKKTRATPLTFTSEAELAKIEKEAKARAIPPSERERLKQEAESLKREEEARTEALRAEESRRLQATDAQRKEQTKILKRQLQYLYELQRDLPEQYYATTQPLIEEIIQQLPQQQPPQQQPQLGAPPPPPPPKTPSWDEQSKLLYQEFPRIERPEVEREFLKEFYPSTNPYTGKEKEIGMKRNDFIKMSVQDLTDLIDDMEARIGSGEFGTQASKKATRYTEQLEKLKNYRSRKAQIQGQGLNLKGGKIRVGKVKTISELKPKRKTKAQAKVEDKLDMEVVKAKRKVGRPKKYASAHSEMAGGGLLKDIIKGVAKSALDYGKKQVKENPIETALKVIEVGKKVRDVGKKILS